MAPNFEDRWNFGMIWRELWVVKFVCTFTRFGATDHCDGQTGRISIAFYRDCVKCVDKIAPMVAEFGCKNCFGERLEPGTH